ncbi:pyridoxamine 5'-phosphate oxidase family protein [Rhizobium calliandrae]|uniref:Pyridoxamine 5'-phosphate oxidase family protein n=1 Tax=Rhizobium calliandrae TaxID=1312182 RepID=A0ABT7KMB6_9HYPH|nr:pyridoxamine 5'-phosphate oxidase family protein [Rhizobium calliandrae]MDL2409292.1 pyridoxamine 5'-phosphate oxidase family protein [Rhizobium calliandrae]
MNDKPSVLRQTDDDARRQARILLRSARYAALAVIDPKTGFPSVSRVLTGTDIDGVPVILVSGLSAHTGALSKDPRASVLFGEPGRGDPLAHPRLSVQCSAERINRQNRLHGRIRARFLARHPKAKLYADFPDFCFFRLVPLTASLNGGFGKAYILPGDDLMILSAANEALAEQSDATVQELLARYPDIITSITGAMKGSSGKNWRICGLDMAGIDLVWRDQALRWEFNPPLGELSDTHTYISKIAYSIP